MAFKYLNNTWLAINDKIAYTCNFPTYPLNVYMAFFRPYKSIGCQSIKDLDMHAIGHLEDHEVSLMFAKTYLTSHSQSRAACKSTQKIHIYEGTYVQPNANQAFAAKAALRPQLISNKEASPKRKKPELDVDYLPDEDMADTEDDRLELEAVVEKS